jgi:cytidine deaminase
MPILLVPADYTDELPDGREDGSGKIIQTTVEGLLPLSFGPGDLELPRGAK